MASFCLWATKLGAVFSPFVSMRTLSAVTAANTLCSPLLKQIQENPIETELLFVSLGMLLELEPCISFSWNTCILRHLPLNLCWGCLPSGSSFRNYLPPNMPQLSFAEREGFIKTRLQSYSPVCFVAAKNYRFVFRFLISSFSIVNPCNSLKFYNFRNHWIVCTAASNIFHVTSLTWLMWFPSEISRIFT